MVHVLTFIDKNNEGYFHCYRSTKTSLDDTNQDFITSENSDSGQSKDYKKNQKAFAFSIQTEEAITKQMLISRQLKR